VRIAQLCPPWLAVPPKGYGGIEWVVALLADGLAEAGHEVTLFATGDSETKARLEYVFEEAPGSKAINDIVLDTTHTLFSLRDARERFDVLHVHSPFSALAASVETGVPTVHTLHGSFVPDMTRLYSYVADRAWFVAISEAQKRFNEDLRYAGVVYNGIDMDFYAMQEDKEDFVLFLGRAAPEKGWRRAIETAVAAGEAARVGRQDLPPHRAGGVEEQRGADPPLGLRGARRDHAGGEGEPVASGQSGAVPDRLAGAVRSRHDRGDGLRDAVIATPRGWCPGDRQQGDEAGSSTSRLRSRPPGV
jgi:hypothetical protein